MLLTTARIPNEFRSQMNTDGSVRKFTLKGEAKIMLTSNLNLSDKLCNGQIGIVKHIKKREWRGYCNIFKNGRQYCWNEENE